MKVRTLALCAGVSAPLLASDAVFAGLTGISTVSKPNPVRTSRRQRVRRVRSPGEDFLIAVAGTANSPLLIQVENGTFFDANGGTDTAPSAFFISVIPSLAFDTFVTIGIKFTEPLTDALVIIPGFPVGITGSALFMDESGWAVSVINPQGDPFNPLYVAGDGRILIGSSRRPTARRSRARC